ncbi:hypothetical protein GKQ77_21090 [Streptomyces sp. BG9H]|uniref:Uncharacterized protein n=1 Tax=Streptomyces anatolicus TaxID=2675858 RepID=A0ABS6YRJ2_9ACTN|nr:hypothetical protein [Streptomyces anatolicus]MBW5424030.1 hypothetical protein [Streptomyces anatolicus]
MSELLDVVDQIVPYVATTGATVIATAQADFAQHALDRGKEMVRALLRRAESAESDVPPEEQEQHAALRSLSRPALEELAVAVDAWLAKGDPSPDALRRHVEAAAGARGEERNWGTGHGTYALGIGKIEGGLIINHGPADSP